jgi:hypothetical protein
MKKSRVCKLTTRSDEILSQFTSEQHEYGRSIYKFPKKTRLFVQEQTVRRKKMYSPLLTASFVRKPADNVILFQWKGRGAGRGDLGISSGDVQFPSLEL